MTRPRVPPPTALDVEGQRAGDIPANPYTGAGLPQRSFASRLAFKIKCLLWMSVGCFLMHRLNFYRVIQKSPHVRHEWFKIGLAGTIALLGIKAYIELYEGRMRKQKVNYETFRQSTHLGIFLLLFSSVAYHVAIWPHYGWNSPVVLMVCLFGVIVPFLLLVPSWVQNLTSFVALTFFLQEYK